MRVITIGRSSDNDVVIGDFKVSRTHLQLVRNDKGEFSVVDLNSANGTYVNGKRISGEVRVYEGDSIRIGDTVLEWQKYFMQVPGKGCRLDNSSNSVKSEDPQAPRPKTPWMWIAICFALLLAGGIWLYISQTKKEQLKQETIRQEYEANEAQLKLEAEQSEAKRMQDKADNELYREKLREARDNNKDLAEKKQKEAEEAKRQAAEANKEKETAEVEKKEAESLASEATKMKEAAEEARRRAEEEAKDAKQAEKIAQQEKEAALRKSKLAIRENELTKEFYSEYLDMNKQTAERVLEIMREGKDVPEAKDAKTYLRELFDKSNIEDKQSILDAIKTAKRGRKEIGSADTSAEAANDALPKEQIIDK